MNRVLNRARYVEVGVSVLLAVTLAWQFAGISALVQFSPDLLVQALSPMGGDVVSLPPAVVEGEELVSASGAERLALSDALVTDSLFQQRIVERLYPVRQDQSSRTRLFRTDEEAPENCRPAARSENLILYDC